MCDADLSTALLSHTTANSGRIRAASGLSLVPEGGGTRWGVEGGGPPRWPRAPTLVGAVGVRLVAVVPTVVVAVAGPVLRDAAPAVALELGAGAGVAAARLVAVVPTVIVWGGGRQEGKRRAGGQHVTVSATPAWGPHSLLPIPNLNPPQPPHQENKKQKRHRNCIDCSMHHGPRGGGQGEVGRAPGGPFPQSARLGVGAGRTPFPFRQWVGTGVCLPGGKERDFSG